MAFQRTHKALATNLDKALQKFQSSSSKFRVLQTINPLDPTNPQPPAPVTPSDSPRTLFILDSSFNPPSIAHKTLVECALRSSNSSKFPTPHRLLLLFSTQNADKAPSAASFDQRLTLMTIFASDILSNLLSSTTSTDSSIPSIDIGVTTAPYYTDKSAAIDADSSSPNAYYPRRPDGDTAKHIHLIGFDTATRFFAPKYYPSFSPPLSALQPYFTAGHSLRVTLRPDPQFGSVADQRAWLARLGDGELEAEGGKREWAKQVEVVQANERAEVSSTKIRKAAKAGEWEIVKGLCTEGVARWVESAGLYVEDARGSKMG
ncbi:hypothetical protein B0A48_09083 [Cryoendolithus antarcticus]|uniref:Nicotinamide-nucleotide adenylyltransferase n=1 Tax=Cryoendolithus antarcticus TaxID=1507870 RepID=A0A1V8T1L3_9PEZI|nr:hypothetical protein B0A48_09083 [Cryoendolithus antarcticus]